eukprot:4809166-Amphidinium_carterae.1
MDQGPVGFPGMGYLLRRLHLRGTVVVDRLHRLTNDWQLACTGANLHTHRAQWRVVLNARTGPFHSAAHHERLLVASKSMFDHLRPDSSVFLHLYEEFVAENWETERLADIGSEQHRGDLFRRLPSLLGSARMHEEVKLSWWFAFEHRAEQLLNRDGGVHATFLTLLYYGWSKGWWRATDSSPLAWLS